jgi:hypothetical protein
MAEKGFPLEQPQVGQAPPSDHAPTPLQAEAARELSASPRLPAARDSQAIPPIPQEVHDKAFAAVDFRPDQIKQRMTPEERQAVKDIETFVLKADVPGLAAYLNKFAAQPKDAEKVMNTVVRDLAAVNVWTSWNYSFAPPAPIPGWKGAVTPPQEIGNFNLTMSNRFAQSPGLRISTDGKATPVNTPGSTRPETAQMVLKVIRDEWLHYVGYKRLESLR